jgi:F-type H+-transporting ATPase subunit a
VPETGVPHAAPAVEGAVSAAPAQAHAAGSSGHSSHAFDFDALNLSHNYPYPAIAWGHGKPQLILDLAGYASKNYASLSADEKFTAVVAAPGHVAWAQDVAAKKGIEAGQLAKAMTLAEGNSLLGSLPRPLSFFNHQTFWSTLALLVLATVLLVTHRRKPEQLKPQGRVQHMIESVVLFVRDEIVRPNIPQNHGHGHGHGDAHAVAAPAPDAWTPFFTAILLALITCNLVGLIPIFGTATGHIGVTAAWSLIIAGMMLFLGMYHNGIAKFWINLVPVKWSWNPGGMLLWFFLFFLELVSLFSRPIVLAVRLFANMFAGHIALLVFLSLGFVIYASSPGSDGMAGGIGLLGWVVAVPLYALELLVCFLQAYIFTLLSAVFIGLCIHQEH